MCMYGIVSSTQAWSSYSSELLPGTEDWGGGYGVCYWNSGNSSCAASSSAHRRLCLCPLTDCVAPSTTGYDLSGAKATDGTSNAVLAQASGFDVTLVACATGYSGSAAASVCSAAGAAYMVSGCVGNTCQQRTTPVTGYSTLPTCEVRTSGSIACSQLPLCNASTHVGSPTLADMSCDTEGAELSLSGCCLVLPSVSGMMTIAYSGARATYVHL